uniref:Uncharacterized protein n=1 Tax=Mola mola TaxID=94237 RepID=A0A3Q3X3Y6_MOLML
DCTIEILFIYVFVQSATFFLTAARNASASTNNLKDVLADLIPKEQTRIKNFKQQHGKSTIGQVTVDMVTLSSCLSSAYLWTPVGR